MGYEGNPETCSGREARRVAILDLQGAQTIGIVLQDLGGVKDHVLLQVVAVGLRACQQKLV